MSEEIQAVPTTMKAVTKFSEKHAHEVGLPSPEAINFMMSVATMLTSSALVSKDMAISDGEIIRLKGMGFNPQEIMDMNDKAVKSNAMAKMLVGHEMGISPMASLQDIDIVKSKIFVRYPQLINQMMMKGFRVKWVERSNERAAIEVTRPESDPELFEFTIKDAKQAGLLEGSKPEYNQYLLRPRVMLTARVASEAYRVTGGRGNVYTPEEKAEIFSGDPDSSTGEPSETDQARVDAMNAKYEVKLKQQPQTVDAKPEPNAEPATEPAKQEPAPDTATVAERALADKFEIFSIMKTATGEEKQVHVEDQPNPDAAKLRVAALVGETGCDHVVTHWVNGQKADGWRTNAKPKAAPKEKKDATASTDTGEAKARMTKLAADWLGGIAEKTAFTRFTAFMCGYLGCDAKGVTKTAIEDRKHALAVMEYAVAGDVASFNENPERYGKNRRAWELEIAEFAASMFTKDPATAALAVQLYIQHGNTTAEEFKTWFSSDSIALDFQKAEDAHAALRVLLRTREGFRLLKASREHLMSVALMVKQIEERALDGKTIEEAPKDVIERAITAFVQAIRDAAKEALQANKPEPPAEEEEEDNLFGKAW